MSWHLGKNRHRNTAKTVADLHKHAAKRALERYHEFFTLKDMEDLSRSIQQGEAKFLLNESHSRSHWLIQDKFIVVYNKHLKAITTFLPPESIWCYLEASREAL